MCIGRMLGVSLCKRQTSRLNLNTGIAPSLTEAGPSALTNPLRTRVPLGTFDAPPQGHASLPLSVPQYNSTEDTRPYPSQYHSKHVYTAVIEVGNLIQPGEFKAALIAYFRGPGLNTAESEVEATKALHQEVEATKAALSDQTRATEAAEAPAAQAKTSSKGIMPVRIPCEVPR